MFVFSTFKRATADVVVFSPPPFVETPLRHLRRLHLLSKQRGALLGVPLAMVTVRGR